jgi:glutamate N-acetyltransferase/amino-acid N-acetyltransferase
MATMLAVVATDLSVSPSALQAALRYAADRSFNSISIDGDTSTNDSLVVLANGQAPAWKQQAQQQQAQASKQQYGINGPNDAQFPAFQRILTEYLIELAHKIVRDGEGATKFVTVHVTGARSYSDAKTIANSIATSMLVKTALYGQDANWGRILCATGYAGVPIDANKVNLYIKPTEDKHAPPAQAAHSAHGSMPPTALTDAAKAQEGAAATSTVGGAATKKPLDTLHLVRGGQPFDNLDESHASALFRERDITLHVDLGLGNEEATCWTCDLSNEYVNINADYRS